MALHGYHSRGKYPMMMLIMSEAQSLIADLHTEEMCLVKWARLLSKPHQGFVQIWGWNCSKDWLSEDWNLNFVVWGYANYMKFSLCNGLTDMDLKWARHKLQRTEESNQRLWAQAGARVNMPPCKFACPQHIDNMKLTAFVNICPPHGYGLPLQCKILKLRTKDRSLW